MNHQLLKRIASSLTVLLLLVFVVGAQVRVSPPAAHPEKTQQVASDEGDLVKAIRRGDLTEVSKLLMAGTSPDEKDDEGASALCWAVRMNRRDLVELLLEKGADVNSEEDDGSAALDVAAAFGHVEMVRLVLSHGAVVDHKDHGGHTALIAAAMASAAREMPAFVLESMWGQERTAENDQLLANMGKEHQAVTELLLSAGADVNLQAEDCGMTALMGAALSGNVELVQLLLSHGAKVNLKSAAGDALEFSETLDSPAVKAELLDGEDEAAKQSLLIWCQATAAGRQQVARLLRAAGARK